MDLTKSTVGKLCAGNKVFVADPAIGELEFEADENEVTLKAKDMNGEWAILIPNAAGAATGNAQAGKTGQTGQAGGKTGAETGGKAEGEKAGEINLTGVFNKNIAVTGGNSKQDILFPADVSGL